MGQKLKSINGLRAISILLVIIDHLSNNYHIFANAENVRPLMPFVYFFRDSQLGVNVFFVISGFLITTLLLREEAVNGRVSLKDFYIRRTLRIFPAYYFLLFVYFILQLVGHIHIGGASWLTSLTYTKYFNWYGNDWQTAHFWSLSVEEHFYLIWPFVFVLGVRVRKAVAFFWVLMVPALRVLVEFYQISWLNELTIFLRIDAIATGCLLAIYKDDVLFYLKGAWGLKLSLLIVALFSLRYAYLFTDMLHLSFIWIPLGVTHGTVSNILIGLILISSVFCPENAWTKLLNSSPFEFIGKLSYSIYLWQQLFINKTDYLINQYPLNLLYCLLAAMGSYYFIEEPFLKLKLKFGRANTKTPLIFNETVSPGQDRAK